MIPSSSMPTVHQTSDLERASIPPVTSPVHGLSSGHTRILCVNRRKLKFDLLPCLIRCLNVLLGQFSASVKFFSSSNGRCEFVDSIKRP